MNTVSEAEIVYNGTNHTYSVLACHAPHPASMHFVTSSKQLTFLRKFFFRNILELTFCTVVLYTLRIIIIIITGRKCNIILILIIWGKEQQKIVFPSLLQTYAWIFFLSFLFSFSSFVTTMFFISVSYSLCHYGLDGPGIGSRWESDFPHPSTLAQGPIQPPTQWATRLFAGGKAPGYGVYLLSC